MEETVEYTEDPTFPLTSLAMAQEALERAGISSHRLRSELGKPDLLVYSLEELVEDLGETWGVESAAGLASMFLGELERVSAINQTSADIDEDDWVIKDVVTKSEVKQSARKVTAGTVKELLRKLRASVPLTKYASLDNNVREYLLYTLMCAHAHFNKELIVPDFLKRKIVSPAEFEQHGERVAGFTPARYGVGISTAATAGSAGSKRAKGAGEGMLVDQPISIPVQKVSHLS